MDSRQNYSNAKNVQSLRETRQAAYFLGDQSGYWQTGFEKDLQNITRAEFQLLLAKAARLARLRLAAQMRKEGML